MNAITTRVRPLERIRQLEELGPRRLTGTPLEKTAQEKLGAELAALGFSLDWRPYTFTQNLYAGLMVHFGLAVLGTVLGFWWPIAGALLHGFVAVSYTLESTRRGLLLRSLFPSIHSQNLVCTLPAKSTLRRRLVLVAHADAAFTGKVFTPALIKVATKEPPKGLGWFKKQLGLATATVAVNGVLFTLATLNVWYAPWWLVSALTIPAFLTFAFNVDVVLRNQVVPGAADNLSGCSGCVELAHRLAGKLPDDVELVVVFSGSEEAGTGGALRLAQQLEASNEWKKDQTVVLGLDTLSNGTLRYLEEGELWPIAVPADLEAAIIATNAEGGEQAVKYVIPTGATDALPFLVRGWKSVSLTCIDPEIGAPRHYHHPTDTWSNVDEKQLGASIDYAERLIRRLSA
ncbi:MAG: M28 family peptidase [Archangium sp.]